jgi:serine/threonine protein phosphatase PrpC
MSPQQQQQHLQSPLRPATSASDSSDDGAGFLEVGVAEDPNPRFRPTMEDAHVVRLGDDWLHQDAAATARGGALASPQRSPVRGAGGGATGRRAASLDWGSPSAASPTRRGAGAGGSTQFPQHEAQGGSRVKSGYFAIYDGHGGREAVDYIERHLHRQVARQLREGNHPARALEAAFLDTDKAMLARGEYNESGSTVASALIRPSTSRAGQRDLFVANVGDARAVVAVHAASADGSGAGANSNARSNGGGAPLKAVRLSRDHTPNDPAEADRVRRAGGAVFRGRVDGQLAVSRAMGDHALRRSGVSALPHQQHLPLTRDHKFMIVACDGLWDVITDQYDDTPRSAVRT